MNTITLKTKETLQKVFANLEISATDKEFDKSAEMVTKCKADGYNAYETATKIIDEFDLQPWYTAMEAELIQQGLFKH